MSSKDKSLQDKLRDFLKRNKGHAGNIPGRSEFVLSEDLLRDLSYGSPITVRIKILKDLSDKVTLSKLENNALEKLWNSVKDLFGKEHTTETRHLAFTFLQCLLKGQSDKMKIMRAQFFRFIKEHDHPEDVGQRLELLNTLTTNGKYILYFEEEVGPFLLNWLPDISKAGKIEEYLTMIDNVIRFNAAYLDDEVITGFIQHICVLSCSTSNYRTVTSCLQIMSTIVAYSNMSPDSLPKFIGALCRTVNIEEYCAPSWKIMKNLLGTHMGHSTLYTMCRILQEPSLRSDTDLLRGAVFYIHMALWGSTPISNLHCPPSSVLPSFLQACKCNQAAVAFEVILGLQHLVNKHGTELLEPSWSILLQVITHVLQQIDLKVNQVPNKFLVPPIHETLNAIESLVDIGGYNGSIRQFFDVIEKCSSDRPESSILRLITYLAQYIVPTEHLWVTNLYNLLHKYLRNEFRTNIRLKVLDILSNVIKLHRRNYEEELIDRIVIPHMINAVQMTDIIVRSSVAELLIDMCMECESKKCLDLLDVTERFLNRPFENYPPDTIVANDSEHCDVKCLVSGLVKVFTIKIYKLPSSHALKIYKMLVNFLEQHYAHPKVFENCPQVRYMIFDCFLKMRADSLFHLGCPAGNRFRFSRYLCVTYRSVDRGPVGSPPPQSPTVTQQPTCTVTYISLRRAFQMFILCLKSERDWEVLNLVLCEMTKCLQNKSLVLCKYGNNELDLLVHVLCMMITDRSMQLPESLNVKVSKPDFQAMVLQVLVNLASYHNYLDQIHQQKMIRCLSNQCTNTTGPKSSKHCIAALTICTLEMKEAMVKLLPEVLLNLSKISATVHISIPVLEFLSTLTQLPMVFSNFVADQYMAVFAISLPYTNPFRYNHYTVSLAHHVIAVWFLKCRLPFRKDFVKFITKGLQTNVLIPFEETRSALFNQSLSDLNQDSSDRKRSSSLTEQGSRGRSAAVSSMRMDKSVLHRPSPSKLLITLKFYEELTETCIDLMARYAFSPCSGLPKRLPVANFLLSGGQSMCWLLGNKLVTVTTSGCSQKVLKQGLCDKCWTLCNTQSDSRKSTRSSSNENEEISWASRQNSNEKSANDASVSSPVDETRKLMNKFEAMSSKIQQLASAERHEREMCACWCQGWAEIHVRRPTGDTSWVMRIQNDLTYTHASYEFPLNEVSTLFMPALKDESNSSTRPPLKRQETSEEPSNQEDERGFTASNSSIGSPKQSPSRQNSRESVDEEIEYVYDDGTKSRNPVRRSNSSPEMSASWKNPFLHQKLAMDGDESNTLDDENTKKNKMYTKDMRVSCEAIPEEIAGAGTTPPSHDPLQLQKSYESITSGSVQHPLLLSCHSYPGSSPPTDSNIAPKLYQTVPPSPNVAQLTSSQPEFPKRPSNLPSISNMGPLSGKPPQSPTQTSPRLARHFSTRDREGHDIQKSSSTSIIERNTSNVNLNLAREKAKERKNSGSVERLSSLDPNQAQKRDRVHTISVMSPATRKSRAEQIHQPTRSRETPRSGINPSFVFLQLYHSASFGNNTEKPLIVGTSEMVQRSLKVLDLIPPYETHTIGVLYISDGQINSEAEILKNKFGSFRYVEFLQSLGSLVKLSDVDPQVCFLGGLDQTGEDGKFAYIWQDDVIRMTFHVATMMPTKDNDPNCNNKKRHIGNNYVNIVYNESLDEFNVNTIKGQLNFASIIIQPLDHNTNRVVVKVKEELKELIAISEPKIVSDQNVAILARQLALHANLASLVASSLKCRKTDPYASNWLERLRKIKNIKTKIIQEQKKKKESSYPIDDPITKNEKYMEDFTDYT